MESKEFLAAKEIAERSESTPRFTRRQALKISAGMAGAVAGLAAGVTNALAQSGPSSGIFLPLVNSDVVAEENHDPHDPDLSELWSKVEKAFGNTKGQVMPGDVLVIDLPRTDISATIMGVAVDPDFALDGEIAFQSVGELQVMKFEVCLLDEEVNPVLSAYFGFNLQPVAESITALHNHYLGDKPAIKFLHGFAVGKAEELAHALYVSLKENSGTPFGHGDEPPGDPGFDWKKVADTIGGDAQLTNGILTVSVEPDEEFKERGIRLKPAMLLEHMFNFQSVGDGKVATIDEFNVLPDAADLVARHLRQHKFLVSALHNHELDIQPNTYYLHSWAVGDPIALAQVIHQALEIIKSAPH